MNFSGFGYMWGGCFADHGVLSGNGGFEVKFVEALEFTDDDPALLNNSEPVSDKTDSSEPNKTGEENNSENPPTEKASAASDAASDEVEEISSVSKTESSICRFGWTVQETVKKTKIKTSARKLLEVRSISEVLVLMIIRAHLHHHVIYFTLTFCHDLDKRHDSGRYPFKNLEF